MSSSIPKEFVESVGFDLFALTLLELDSSITTLLPIKQLAPTRRRDQDGPESLEIVLDRPPPPGHTTRFIFDDGTVQNVVRYTLQYGDTNGDGLIDMKDAAALQNCYGVPLSPASGTPPELIDLCLALDVTGEGIVGDEDAAYFLNFLFTGLLP